MNSDKQNFDELQKLLALKRREQPPQQFFRAFPGEVANRLHDARPSRPLSWSERYGLDSPFRPVWFCGLGALVCGLLAAGTFFALHVPPEERDSAAETLTNSDLARTPLPEAIKAEETRSVVEPVASPESSPIEQRNLTPVSDQR